MKRIAVVVLAMGVVIAASVARGRLVDVPKGAMVSWGTQHPASDGACKIEGEVYFYAQIDQSSKVEKVVFQAVKCKQLKWTPLKLEVK